MNRIRRIGCDRGRRSRWWLGAGVVALAAAPAPAHAAVFTWTAGTGNWITAANWNNGAGPAASGPDNTADFSLLTSGKTITLDGDRTIGNLTFGGNDPAVRTLSTATGKTLTLSTSSGTPTIEVDVGTTFINTALAGATASTGLRKTGAGALSLGNAAYTGPTTLEGGTLTLSGSFASTNPITTAAGTTLFLELPGSVTFSNAISGAGGAWVYNRGPLLTLGSGNSYTGPTTLTDAAIRVPALANGGTNSSIGAASAAPVNLFFGGGTLQFNDRFAASTDRLFTIDTGKPLEYFGTPRPGGAAIEVAGAGALNFTGAGSLAIVGTEQSAVLQLKVSNAFTPPCTFAPVIPDGVTPTHLIVSGVGTWILSGSNTFTGGVEIQGGLLQLGSADALNSFTPNDLSGGQLRLAGYSVTVKSLTGSGSVRNDSATAATLTIANATSKTFSGMLADGAGSGPLSITKIGAGIAILTGANSYSGHTTVSAGTLQVGGGLATGSLGGGAVSIGAGATVAIDRNNTVTLSNVLSGAGTLTQMGNGILNLTGSQSWSNGAALNAAAGTTNLQTDPGSVSAYMLAVNATPAAGGAATLHFATHGGDEAHLRDLKVNAVGADGAGLVLIDAAADGSSVNPHNGFGAVGGSVAVYLGDGAGNSGFATRATVENLWQSAALEGYWALQNHLETAITRGITLDPVVVTDATKNGLVVAPSVDNASHAATYVGEDIIGDTNGDAKVDINDLGAVLQHLNTTPGSQAGEAGFTVYTPREGDVNGDLVVNINDLGAVLGNLNQVYAPAAGGGAVGVPEPAGVVVVGAGVAALLRRRRGSGADRV